ncbi:hypothetical protein IPM65_06525 [Candidatus Roizmanbacteria bacterium]|nr:MAG: hypothetical protein IPM65_06525 [Candidatus Roizmanbacteria bacterium]
MRFVRRIRQVVTIVCIVVYLLANGIPHADPSKVAQAAGTFTISGMVTVNGQTVWDGFGVKITGSRGTTMWAETRGGWYQFTGFSSGTYTIGHNSSCTPNAQLISITGSTRYDIHLTCQTYTLGGYVAINGKPAWKGFGVKATLGDWSTKWGEVVTDDGWYEFKGSNALIAGNYVIHHNHNCPSTTPVPISIPATNNRGPDINLDCPTYTLNGYVKINGVPAWKGFGVKATFGDGTTLWAKVETDDGWYEFRDASRLIQGNYVISHNHSCPSNAPIPIGIPATNNRGPDLYLDCPTFPLHGKVYVNGEPAWKGFGVKVTINGWMTKWIQTQGDDGYYEFSGGNALLEADYVIHHNHPCESNTPAGIHVPAANNQGPNIYITCPDTKHPLYGYVTVNGRPAWKGFGVAAARKNGSTKWVLTDTSGRYEFSGDDILTEGEYTIRHNHNCPSNNDVTVWIPSNGNRGPDFDIRCPAYTLYGYITIDGTPAWKDFGVKASLKDGTTVWALTDENGRYEFKGDVSLIEADYTIHHNHPCPSDSPTNVHVPSTGNRGPDIHLTCGSFNLTGRVTVDGSPAWKTFGVKAVGSNGKSYWALVHDNDGHFAFSNLPRDTYYVGHVHNCATEEGNPVTIDLTTDRSADFNIKCQPSPVPTPTPIPIDPPGGCVGLETRERPMQQYSIKQDFVAYYIVSKATSTLKSNACPGAIFTIGDITTGKLLSFGSHGSYIDVYNDGRIKTNIESITANPKFECGLVWEVITNKKYAYSCETSYGASANLPNLNGNITLNTKIEHEVHVRGDQLALSLAWSISEMTRKVESINIQLTDPNTVVGIFGLGMIGMILYNMSLKFFVFPIFWGEPSPEPAAVASSLSDELPEEILSDLKAAIGEGAATKGVWSEMEVSREGPSTLKLQADGFSPTGGVYVLVTEDELSFPNEAPLHEGSYSADTDGHVYLQIPLSALSEKPLVVIAVDLEDFRSQYARYLKGDIDEIHYRGTAAVLHSDNVTSSLYLPLVER